jgi:hypothetical protein
MKKLAKIINWLWLDCPSIFAKLCLKYKTENLISSSRVWLLLDLFLFIGFIPLGFYGILSEVLFLCFPTSYFVIWLAANILYGWVIADLLFLIISWTLYRQYSEEHLFSLLQK